MKEIIKKLIMIILEWEARAVLAINKPKIIAITGSAGKTSTKDAIFSVLSAHTRARKSEKSFNNELGIPLTIIGLSTGWGNPFKWLLNILEGLWMIVWPISYPEWLILEVGTGTPGDITKLTKWLKPDITVMTAFGSTPVHIEFFASKEAVLEEKRQLARALKTDGTLILNHDDEAIYSTKSLINRRTLSFGRDTDADFVIKNEEINYEEGDGKEPRPVGITFRIEHEGTSMPITISESVGYNHAYSAVAAVAVLKACGFPIVDAAQSLYEHKTTPGRMKLLEGVKGSVIIDDTYNASPLSITNALNTLRDIKTKGRKIAVIGDMLELGSYEEEEHRKIGEMSAEFCDILIFVGSRAQFYVEGALSKDFPDNNLHHFDNSREAGKFVEQLVGENDIVLIKGSQGVRMERAVKEMMQHPEIAKYKLVRQEKSWLQEK